jgi:hypothetical protein
MRMPRPVCREQSNVSLAQRRPGARGRGGPTHRSPFQHHTKDGPKRGTFLVVAALVNRVFKGEHVLRQVATAQERLWQAIRE